MLPDYTTNPIEKKDKSTHKLSFLIYNYYKKLFKKKEGNNKKRRQVYIN